MFRRIIFLLLFFSLLLPACIFRKPIEVKKEYYASGNLKSVRKIYKNGTERKKYYTDGAVHDTPKSKKKK